MDRIVSSLAGGRLSQVNWGCGGWQGSRIPHEYDVTSEIYMPWGEVLDSIVGSNIFDQALVPGPLLRQHLANVESSLPTNFTLLYPSSGTIFCIRLQVQSYNSGWWCFSGLCENDDDKNDDDNLSFITMLMPMIITAMSKWRRHTFLPECTNLCLLCKYKPWCGGRR